MNQVVLIGRLTRDPELRFVPSSGKAVANFTLAVNRVYSKEKEADFFRIVVWGKQAENVATYLKKGSQCAVSGSIHNNNYTDRDGTCVIRPTSKLIEWNSCHRLPAEAARTTMMKHTPAHLLRKMISQ